MPLIGVSGARSARPMLLWSAPRMVQPLHMSGYTTTILRLPGGGAGRHTACKRYA
jgi:hypothetical protein